MQKGNCKAQIRHWFSSLNLSINRFLGLIFADAIYMLPLIGLLLVHKARAIQASKTESAGSRIFKTTRSLVPSSINAVFNCNAPSAQLTKVTHDDHKTAGGNEQGC